MFSFRRLFIISFVIFFANQQNLYAQNKFEVVAGKNVGIIKIGDCKDSVLKYINSKYTEKTFLQEKESFIDVDFSTLPQFILGFDKVFIFDDFPFYQVFKVYFNKDSLNFIMLTSYGFNSAKSVSKYKTPGSIKFYASPEKVKKVFGEPEMMVTTKNNETEYIYWSKGIEFEFDENQLVVIYIYKPIVKTIK